MKRFFILLFSLSLLLSLCGCVLQETTAEDPILFYYERNVGEPDKYLYGTADGVIAPEEREVSSRTDDLNFLLTMYLEGPVSDNLVSPFPRNATLEDILWDDRSLIVTVTGSFSDMTDLDMTLAGAALSSTCFGLTDAQTVTFTALSGSEEKSFSITLSRDSIIFVDDSIPAEEPTP